LTTSASFRCRIVLTSCHYKLYERQMLNSPRVHLTFDVMLREHASTSSGMNLHVHYKHGGDKMAIQTNDTHVCTHQLPPRTRCPAACQQAAPVQRNRGSLAQLAPRITHHATCRIRADLSMQHLHRQSCTVHLSEVPPWLPGRKLPARLAMMPAAAGMRLARHVLCWLPAQCC
jgi:hypothetical protein